MNGATRAERSDRTTDRQGEAELPRESGSTAALLRRGLEGGAIATLVMTAYRLPVTRSLPPTAEFWAKFVVGGRPGDHPIPAIVLHFVYGIAAGAAVILLPNRRSVPGGGPQAVTDDSRDGPPDGGGEVTLTVLGLLYGLALSVFGERVVLGRILRTDPDDRFAFHVGHVLYGITLGAWVGTRTRSDD